MADIKIPKPVKLFSGFIYSDEADYSTALQMMKQIFGEADVEAGPFEFEHTTYYKMMGTTLVKKLVSFEKPIERDVISDIKIYTNGIESDLSKNGYRTINIDPGYMNLSNVFLASCKEYYHRVYIGKGIYLENEYYYKKGAWEFFEWTYPDYKKEEYLKFFYKMRDIYSGK